LNITDVRIRRITKEGRLRAIAAITIDDAFVVHDIKVIEGDDHLYIAMPSRQSPDGIFRDIAHPINAKVREDVQEIVLKRYKEVMEAAE